MADLDPITAEDLEALRSLLEGVDRGDLEALDAADLLTVAGADATAVVAAANTVFGLLDLLAQRDSDLGHAQANLAEILRQQAPRKQASGAALWGQPRSRNG